VFTAAELDEIPKPALLYGGTHQGLFLEGVSMEHIGCGTYRLWNIQGKLIVTNHKDQMVYNQQF